MRPRESGGQAERPDAPAEPDPLTFDAYLRRRGYDPAGPGFLRRMFVDVWAEPSFRDFWRVWNPVYGFALFRLYVALGGHRRPALTSLVVFAASGFVLHDLPVALATGKPGVGTTVAFVAFWALVVTERGRSDRSARRRRLANVARVALGLGLGVVADAALAAATRA